jgi:hypothetical protein
VRKTCQQQVKDQMQRMNDAGTIPKSSVPKHSDSSQADSAYSDELGGPYQTR